MDLINEAPEKHMKTIRTEQPKAEKANLKQYRFYPDSWLKKQVYRKPCTPLVEKR